MTNLTFVDRSCLADSRSRYGLTRDANCRLRLGSKTRRSTKQRCSRSGMAHSEIISVPRVRHNHKRDCTRRKLYLCGAIKTRHRSERTHPSGERYADLSIVNTSLHRYGRSVAEQTSS
jgi:hypothetical protein